MGASGDVIFSEINKQTFTRVSDSHWVAHSYSLLPDLRKKLGKLLYMHS